MKQSVIQYVVERLDPLLVEFLDELQHAAEIENGEPEEGGGWREQDHISPDVMAVLYAAKHYGDRRVEEATK